MKLTIHKARDFVIVWQNGQIDLYLKSKGNYDTAYSDLKDEDLRILKGMWNHLNSMKNRLEYSQVEIGIEEVLKALDRIFDQRN